jgi:Uma2 family endonuclease
MKPPRTRETTPAVPLLRDGDRLSQPEFHRRYEAYPEGVKIELIGGIVHVASPMKRPHGVTAPRLSAVLIQYEVSTPGVEVAGDMTTILGEKSEPQPDLMLRILTDCDGQSRYNERDYLVGPPEFIAEVSHATRSLDLKAKKEDYLAAGVQEYLVVDLEEQALHWFHFPSKRKLKADKQGLWKSRVFPGLWLDGPALFALDSAKLIAAVQQGIASPEHDAFVRQLAERPGQSESPTN